MTSTMELAAAIRAEHLNRLHPLIRDPRLFRLISPGWRLILKWKLLHHLVFNRYLRVKNPGMFGAIILRRAFADEWRRKLQAKGVDQLLILCAGLDTIGFLAAENVGNPLVIEVDHPKAQSAKKRRLKDSGTSVPENVCFLPLDLEAGSLAELLKSQLAPLCRKRPVFVVWLGATFYLREQTVLQVLRELGSLLAPGSVLVFDYALASVIKNPQSVPAAKWFHRFAARRKEPMLTGFDPVDIPTTLEHAGFHLMEHLGASELQQRFCEGRNHELTPPKFVRLCAAQVPRRK